MADLNDAQIDELVDAQIDHIITSLRAGSSVGMTAAIHGVPQWVVVKLGQEVGLVDENFPVESEEQ